MASFDPLLYLNLQTSQEDRIRLSGQILDQLSEYLMIRIMELLPEEDLVNINSSEEFFKLAKSKIPNIEERSKVFLEDFKKEVYGRRD